MKGGDDNGRGSDDETMLDVAREQGRVSQCCYSVSSRSYIFHSNNYDISFIMVIAIQMAPAPGIVQAEGDSTVPMDTLSQSQVSVYSFFYQVLTDNLNNLSLLMHHGK